jgi:hypothetical protein
MLEQASRGPCTTRKRMKMNVPEGAQEEEGNAEVSVADAGKDPLRVIMSHVISNWNKKLKEWKA